MLLRTTFKIHLQAVGFKLIIGFLAAIKPFTGWTVIGHLVNLQQRISYCVISLIWRSLLGFAPAYLRDLCHTTVGIPGRRSLRSTEQGLLLVQFAHTAIMQNRAF